MSQLFENFRERLELLRDCSRSKYMKAFFAEYEFRSAVYDVLLCDHNIHVCDCPISSHIIHFHFNNLVEFKIIKVTLHSKSKARRVLTIDFLSDTIVIETDDEKEKELLNTLMKGKTAADFDIILNGK